MTIVYNRNGVPFDIDNIATDLNGKADCDLTNVNDTGTAKVANWAMPSDTYIDVAVGASDATYTAPADGYYEFKTTNTSTQANYTYLVNGTTKIGTYQMANAGVIALGFVPVRKGDIVSLGYYSSIIESFIFVYAEGTKGEA